MRAVELSSVCEVIMGQAPKGDTYNDNKIGYPLVAGAGDFGRTKPEVGKYTSAPTKISKPGDIILCVRATIGDRNWSDGEYCLGRGVAGLRIDNDKLNKNYLWHWIDYAAPILKSKGRGATFLQVSKKDISTLLIPLPPLSEQKRISAILGKADALREKRRQTIAKLDELLQSVFFDMFGDPSKNPNGFKKDNLGNLIVDGPQNGLYKQAKEYGTGTPILRIDAFYDGEVRDLSKLKRVRISQTEIKRYLLRNGDIIINRVNSRPFLGKSALIRKINEPTVFESNMMRFSVDNTLILPEYLVEFLQTKFIKNQIMNRCKDAVNQSSINQQDVKSFIVNLPPIHLQSKYLKIKLAILNVIKKMKTQYNVLDTMFASLQQRAFKGKL